MGLLGWCRTKKALTDEERELQAKSLFSEFLSAGDSVEALTLARELAAPGEPTPSHLSPSSHATSANPASGGSKEHHCPAHLDRHISKLWSWNECSAAQLLAWQCSEIYPTCTAGFMPKLVDTGIDALFETIRPKEQEMLTDLLVSLLRRNAYSLDDFITGMKLKTDTLEDLA